MKSRIDIMLELIFPKYSHPKMSRFASTFESIFENGRPSIRTRKKTFSISLDKIANGEDKRTSLMIKNLPCTISKEWFKSILSEAGNINYLYLPFDKKTTKFLGFAFVNVVNYKTIIQLHQKLYGKKLKDFDMKRSIEMCYSKVQGKQELIQMFNKNNKI